MIEYAKLTNRTITMAENMAAELKAVPGERGYSARISRIHNMLHINVETVDAIITKNIGEKWKAIPGYESYKVSNYGRLIGINGTLITSYISKSGIEIFDPYLSDRSKRRHLAVKSAIARAFLRPKKFQKVVYSGSDKINTIHHLAVA
jgi:hypothetical protein